MLGKKIPELVTPSNGVAIALPRLIWLFNVQLLHKTDKPTDPNPCGLRQPVKACECKGSRASIVIRSIIISFLSSIWCCSATYCFQIYAAYHDNCYFVVIPSTSISSPLNWFSFVSYNDHVDHHSYSRAQLIRLNLIWIFVTVLTRNTTI